MHPHDPAAIRPEHPRMKFETQTMRVASRDPSPRARRVFASIPHNLTLNHNLNRSHNLTLTLNLTLLRPLPHEESLADQAVLPRELSKNLPKPANFCHFLLRNRYNRYIPIRSCPPIFDANAGRNPSRRAGGTGEQVKETSESFPP
jgi:hypothetical protein